MEIANSLNCKEFEARTFVIIESFVNLRSPSVPKAYRFPCRRRIALVDWLNSITFGENPMEIGLGLLTLVVGSLMLLNEKPPKKEEPKEELLYKIEVKKPK